MKKPFLLTTLAIACASASWAQSPGIVYPTIQPDAKAAVAAVPALPASSQSQAAPAPTVTASAPAGHTYTAPVFKDPRRLDQPPAEPATNARAVFKDPRRFDYASLAAEKPEAEPSKEPPKIVKKKPEKRPILTESADAGNGQATNDPDAYELAQASGSALISKGKDGSKIIRAEVPSNVAEAEAYVTAQLTVPGYKPSPSSSATAPVVPLNQVPAAGVAQQNAPTTNPGLEVKPLPKWVTDSLDKNSGRNQILVMPGVTEIIRIGRNFPNRLVTPFESAEVITTDENLTHDGIGGAVIVATSSDKPIGIFLQDRNSDRAIPVTLIPEDIPQRDIKFILDDSWGVPTLRNNPEQSAGGSVPSAQSDYVEYVKLLMRSMAKGDVPDGHAMAPLQPELAPFCQSPGLQMRLGQMLEGSKTRIAVYTAVNPTKSAVPFQEAGCYRTGVLAVSAFPRPVMEPGQDTEVFVILRKDVASERASAKRRPTLVSQQ